MATEQEIKDYVAKVQAGIDAEWKYTHAESPLLTIDFGKKNAKIVSVGDGGRDEMSRTVHHFVEIETGNILKAASWKTPAKGVRGHISSFTYGEEVNLHGAVYWRM